MNMRKKNSRKHIEVPIIILLSEKFQQDKSNNNMKGHQQ
jgi:hypothetical protein